MRWSALAALLAGLAAGPARAKDAPAVVTAPALALGVHEKTLSNGLQVLTVERPRAPRATCWLFMRTGSVNERPGITGISHLFEHLMFKGTKKLGVRDYALDERLQKEIDAAWDALQAAQASGVTATAEAARDRFDELRAKEKANVVQDELWDLYLANGATGLNAWTSEDMTAYVVTLPANRLELFMWIEADRLANAVFREFYPEREVVKEERRLDENRPDGPYEEELNALFFMAHPYGWPVVGWMSDLDAITPEDCRRYFEVFYAPNNATLVVAGAVAHEEVEAQAERYLGRVPRGKTAPPPVRTKEPRPSGERRLTVRAQAEPRATLLFHAPAIGDPDGPALDVAQAVLGGKTGRLYEALVERDELCVEVSVSFEERRWAGVFEVEGQAREGVAPTRVADALQAELDRLAKEAPGAAELDKARNRLQADLLKQLEDPEALTNLIGHYAVRADWRLIERMPARWAAVTGGDVKRVAARYLGAGVRTVGILEAPGAGGEDEEGKEPAEDKEPAEHPQGPGEGDSHEK